MKSTLTPHFDSIQEAYTEHLAAGRFKEASDLYEEAREYGVMLMSDEEIDNLINQALEEAYE